MSSQCQVELCFSSGYQNVLWWPLQTTFHADSRWRRPSWSRPDGWPTAGASRPGIWRVTLVALVAGLAVINATGVYAQLVAAHVGERNAATSVIETQDATLTARIEVAAHTVADLDRRLGQIDTAIEEAAK